MRDPSIHVSKSVLLLVFDDILQCTDSESAVELLFKLTKGRALVHRNSATFKRSSAKRLKKSIDNSDQYTALFQKLLISYRGTINKRLVSVIYSDDCVTRVVTGY